MKALPFQVPQNMQSSLRVQVDQEPYFYDRLHYHPEWQITAIKAGSGALFIGDSIHRFQAGDVFIVGSNVPHLLKSDPEYYEEDSPGTYALSLFFNWHSFGQGFFDLPELAGVKNFLLEASRGIRFLEAEKKEMLEKFNCLLNLKGYSRLIMFFELLGQLAGWTSRELLSISSFTEAQKESDGRRLNDVIQFTLIHYQQNISLEDVAQIANLSIPAFCRYFKIHTGKSYISFLNEVRISSACRLLKESELHIAQICYETGFQNLSNFNRQFKKIMGMTPSGYREINS